MFSCQKNVKADRRGGRNTTTQKSRREKEGLEKERTVGGGEKRTEEGK